MRGGTWDRLRRAAVLALAAGAGPALSCMVPPRPYDPTHERADAVLVGIVVNDIDDGTRVADAVIAIERHVAGRYDEPLFRLSHWSFDGSGLCAVGPFPHKGDQLVLYLNNRPVGQESGLRILSLADAQARDPRFAAP